ncbi:MAG: hypothetical protein IMF07_02540 [Proteobacteria bacterium]|nr:hypothetical protein [Pseudomonadota bacterium]
MADKSNNEISREVLACLNDHYPKAVKFLEMAEKLEIPEKSLFKNLFFLEENSLVQLMSSYPTGATYPTIHMLKIRDEGRSLLHDTESMDERFPLHGFSSRLDISRINHFTLPELAKSAASMIEKGEGGEKGTGYLGDLEKIAKASSLKHLTLGKIFEHMQDE